MNSTNVNSTGSFKSNKYRSLNRPEYNALGEVRACEISDNLYVHLLNEL